MKKILVLSVPCSAKYSEELPRRWILNPIAWIHRQKILIFIQNLKMWWDSLVPVDVFSLGIYSGLHVPSKFNCAVIILISGTCKLWFDHRGSGLMNRLMLLSWEWIHYKSELFSLSGALMSLFPCYDAAKSFPDTNAKLLDFPTSRTIKK
jgi:hypothetical protein